MRFWASRVGGPQPGLPYLGILLNINQTTQLGGWGQGWWADTATAVTLSTRFFSFSLLGFVLLSEVDRGLGCSSVGGALTSQARSPGCDPAPYTPGMVAPYTPGMVAPTIPAFGRWSQEVIFQYLLSLRTAWATWDTVSTTKIIQLLFLKEYLKVLQTDEKQW